MDLQDGFITNSEGTKLYCKYWKPTLADGEKPRGLVFISHGYGEHARAYDHVAEPLVEKKLLVFCHDHVGHGRSGGARVHVKSFQIYTDDILQHVHLVKDKVPDVPIFMVAHSMGGLIGLKTGLKEPDLFRGMVLIAPAIVIPSIENEKLGCFKLLMIKMFKEKGIGELDNSLNCRDKDVAKWYEDDELTWHGKFKAWHTLCLKETAEEMKNELEKVTWPILCQHGDQDGIVDISSSRMLFDKAASRDKGLSVYQGCYHQVHNEPHGIREKVLTGYTKWICDRLN